MFIWNHSIQDMFLKDYPAYLEDSFVKELTELNRNLILSIDIQPIPTDKALKEIQNQSLAVETDITRWQNKQNQKTIFPPFRPCSLPMHGTRCVPCWTI